MRPVRHFLLLCVSVVVRGQLFNSTDEDLEVFLGESGNIWGQSLMISGSRQPRSKRSVVQLYNMVRCATGCNPFAYKGYGCFCGFLGSGYPVDGIDACCMRHDYCYNRSRCPLFLEYFIPYYWACYGRRIPLCGTTRGGTHPCARRLCECDRELSQCLARYRCPRTKAVCVSSPFRLFQNYFMRLI